MVIYVKINVTLSIDKEIKEKSMYIIQNVLKSSLSQEVENYLEGIVRGVEIEKR